ncbi:pseudouridine synthase [Trinickia terrae]|uniref:pseudouridine synthase n=1 Tax=Trinickia terrae TaxID=2571161 RepID=UPI003F71358B
MRKPGATAAKQARPAAARKGSDAARHGKPERGGAEAPKRPYAARPGRGDAESAGAKRPAGARGEQRREDDTRNDRFSTAKRPARKDDGRGYAKDDGRGYAKTERAAGPRRPASSEGARGGYGEGRSPDMARQSTTNRTASDSARGARKIGQPVKRSHAEREEFKPAPKRPAGERRMRRDETPDRRPAAATGRAVSPPTETRTGGDASETMRLSKRMSELGLCSRREADEWIEKGWVLVDGERVDTLGAKVHVGQHIEIVANARAAQAKQVTILLHKPVGYVSGQAEDGYQPAITLITPANHWEGDRSDVQFSASHLRQLAPAGRLDIDSTGLLVLTQDGRVAKQLIGIHSPIEKEYLVRVAYGERTTDIDQHFPPELLAKLRHGLSLDDVPLRPAKVSWQNGEQLRFVLREGKKRQIRRMCELVGLNVVGLRRIRMGRIPLGSLPPGQWRYLLPEEEF